MTTTGIIFAAFRFYQHFQRIASPRGVGVTTSSLSLIVKVWAGCLWRVDGKATVASKQSLLLLRLSCTFRWLAQCLWAAGSPWSLRSLCFWVAMPRCQVVQSNFISAYQMFSFLINFALFARNSFATICSWCGHFYKSLLSITLWLVAYQLALADKFRLYRDLSLNLSSREKYKVLLEPARWFPTGEGFLWGGISWIQGRNFHLRAKLPHQCESCTSFLCWYWLFHLFILLYGIFVTITRFCWQTFVPLFDNK